MKKIFSLFLVFLLIFTLFGCNKAQKLGIAFICDEDGVEERFEGQALKAAIESYCTENGIPYFEYISDGTEDYYSNAALSASKKCNIAICDSKASSFLADSAESFDIDFLFVNCEKTSQNARSVSFCEEEASFLAGYAAVFDKNSTFGFIGLDDTVSKRYLNGFVQGISYATPENSSVKLSYFLASAENTADEIKSVAQDMYTNGCDVIFICGSDIYKPVVSVANSNKKFLIGCEMDQAGESERFVTSAIKNYTKIVEKELDEFFKTKAWSESFKSTHTLYRTNDGGVGLPDYPGAIRFETFTAEDIAQITAKINTEISVTRSTDIPKPSAKVLIEEVSVTPKSDETSE